MIAVLPQAGVYSLERGTIRESGVNDGKEPGLTDRENFPATNH
jgi:hypothetical protein